MTLRLNKEKIQKIGNLNPDVQQVLDPLLVVSKDGITLGNGDPLVSV